MFEFCYDSKIRATPPYSKRNIFEQKKTINWSLSTQGNQPNLKKKFHRPDWYPLKFPNYKINCFSFYYFIQNDLNVYWSISTWKAENSHQKITLTRNKIKSREKPFKETTKYVELDDNIVIVLSVCIFLKQLSSSTVAHFLSQAVSRQKSEAFSVLWISIQLLKGIMGTLRSILFVLVFCFNRHMMPVFIQR